MYLLEALVLPAAAALAAVVPAQPSPRTAQICYPGESTKYMCFRQPQGTPQDIRVANVKYAAQRLRDYAVAKEELLDTGGNPVLDDDGLSKEVTTYRFLNMSTSTAPNCGEWTIFDQAETVMVTAKLMSPQQSALVWYGDIADSIDGGAAGSGAPEAIMSCGTDGGSREVKVDASQVAYEKHKPDLAAGKYVTSGVVIKIVQNIEWKKANPDWRMQNSPLGD